MKKATNCERCGHPKDAHREFGGACGYMPALNRDKHGQDDGSFPVEYGMRCVCIGFVAPQLEATNG